MTTATVTIPKKIKKGDELVLITRREYVELLDSKRVPEFTPTDSQKKALRQARKNQRSGNFLTFNDLKERLGFTN